MSRADELLAELRKMIAEIRDDDDPDLYHATEYGAWYASAFDQLDSLLSKQGELPQDWQR